MTWDEIRGDDNELRWDGIRSQKEPWHEMRWDEMTWDDDTQLAMRWDGSCELHNIMCNSWSRQDWTHMYTLYHSWHIEDTLRFLITCLPERCLIVVYCHMVPVFCTMTVSHIRIFLNKFADLIVHLQARHHCNVYNPPCLQQIQFSLCTFLFHFSHFRWSQYDIWRIVMILTAVVRRIWISSSRIKNIFVFHILQCLHGYFNFLVCSCLGSNRLCAAYA